MKKIMGFILATVMTVFTVMSPLASMNVCAEEVNVVANITNENDVKTYASWDTALTDAKPDDTLKALVDITQFGSEIELTKSVKLDLDHHLVSGIMVNANDISVEVANGSIQTLGEREGKTGASIDVNNCDLGFVEIENQSSLKMENSLVRMGVEAPKENGENQKSEFINCQVQNDIDIRDGNGAKVYISGDDSDISGITIWRTPDSYVQIDGGKIGTINNCGDTVINDGLLEHAVSSNGSGRVILNGGKYTEEVRARIVASQGIIMPEGKALVLRGEYYVIDTPVDSDYVVSDGENKYITWYEAIANCSNGSKLTALANSLEKISIPDGKIIGLDFGAYTYARGLNVGKDATLYVYGGTYKAGCFQSTSECWENRGTINLMNGVFTPNIFNVATKQGWGFNVENYGTITISGGEFTGFGNVMSRYNGNAWGNTYITGGNFAGDSFGTMTFTNGNANETGQHVFISKGTFCDEMKTIVAINILPGADAVIVDFGDGNFGVMTQAEAKAYADAHKQPEEEPQPEPKPESVAQVGEKIQPVKKDNSGGAYVINSSNEKTATVRVTNGKNAKGKVSVPDKITDSKGNTYKVTEIASSTYKNNKKITTVALGKNITNVGKDAFKGTTKLTKADLGKSKVSSIGKNAFSGAKKLGDIKLNGNTLKSVGKDAFKGVKKNCKITIQAKNKAQYNKIVKMIKKSGAKNVKYKYVKKK